MKKILTLLICLLSLKAAVIINNATNQTISINVSNSTINRIVLPENIKDIAYSQEKGVQINISGNQAFVKFVPIKKNTYKQSQVNARNQQKIPVKTELIYDNAQPLDVYFVTETKTYSFNLIPQNIAQQTIILNDFATAVKDTLKYETEDNYVQTLNKIIKTILNEQVPQGYKVKNVNKAVKKDYQENVKLVNLYEGVIYNAYLFEVTNNTSQQYTIDIQDFFKYIDDKPIAIAVYYDNEYNELLAYDSAKVVLVFKASK